MFALLLQVAKRLQCLDEVEARKVEILALERNVMVSELLWPPFAHMGHIKMCEPHVTV